MLGSVGKMWVRVRLWEGWIYETAKSSSLNTESEESFCAGHLELPKACIYVTTSTIFPSVSTQKI